MCNSSGRGKGFLSVAAFKPWRPLGPSTFSCKVQIADLHINFPFSLDNGCDDVNSNDAQLYS